VTAPPAPEPTYWAHDCASAWTAAWLTARGAKEWMGPREVLRDPELKRRVNWHQRIGFRTTGHRPDLLIHSAAGPVPIEVELQRKSNARTEGILLMYYSWIAEGTITGVAYVCGTNALAERLTDMARRALIPARAWRTDLLDDVREQALYAVRARRPAQAAPAAREG
jgi:hypothetical protein